MSSFARDIYSIRNIQCKYNGTSTACWLNYSMGFFFLRSSLSPNSFQFEHKFNNEFVSVLSANTSKITGNNSNCCNLKGENGAKKKLNAYTHIVCGKKQGDQQWIEYRNSSRSSSSSDNNRKKRTITHSYIYSRGRTFKSIFSSSLQRGFAYCHCYTPLFFIGHYCAHSKQVSGKQSRPRMHSYLISSTANPMSPNYTWKSSLLLLFFFCCVLLLMVRGRLFCSTCFIGKWFYGCCSAFGHCHGLTIGLAKLVYPHRKRVHFIFIDLIQRFFNAMRFAAFFLVHFFLLLLLFIFNGY